MAKQMAKQSNAQQFSPTGFKTGPTTEQARTIYRTQLFRTRDGKGVFAACAIWTDRPKPYNGHWQPIGYTEIQRSGQQTKRATEAARNLCRKHNKAAGRKPRHMYIEEM